MRRRLIRIPCCRGIVAMVFACTLCQFASADEQEVIDAIEKAGGTVRAVAQDTDEKEVAFHLSNAEWDPAVLEQVAQLPNVVWLNLRGTQVSNADLAHLASMASLRRLHLEKTEIGDEGLQHLAGLKNLEYLNLYGTQVTDAGLQHLAGLENLRKLFLWQTAVTSAGARQLKQQLPELEINLGADAEPGPPTQTLAKARYVRVRLEGESRVLSLAEVEIFETGTGQALQTSGSARQSSIDYDGAAERAIDGNTDGTYTNNSVTHTQTQTNPWWLVDLGETKDIGRIVVHNRADCCGDRLQDAVVELFDEGLSIVWSGKVEDAKDGSVTMFEGKSE